MRLSVVSAGVNQRRGQTSVLCARACDSCTSVGTSGVYVHRTHKDGVGAPKQPTTSLHSDPTSLQHTEKVWGVAGAALTSSSHIIFPGVRLANLPFSFFNSCTSLSCSAVSLFLPLTWERHRGKRIPAVNLGNARLWNVECSCCLEISRGVGWGGAATHLSFYYRSSLQCDDERQERNRRMPSV